MSESDWIPVTERLPEPIPFAGVTNDVLVWPRSNCPVAYYLPSRCEWWDSHTQERLAVTHWQPLPDGPSCPPAS